MFINGCGCQSHPRYEDPVELPIIECRQEVKIVLPKEPTDYRDLKCKVIAEYLDALQELECGKRPDL